MTAAASECALADNLSGNPADMIKTVHPRTMGKRAAGVKRDTAKWASAPALTISPRSEAA